MTTLIQYLQYLLNGITLGAIYALIALGYTMVYGILKFINFAHGDILMVGAYAGLFIFTFLLGESTNASSQCSSAWHSAPCWACSSNVSPTSR